jgi:DNA-binding NarL/FixJ family response regulator
VKPDSSFTATASAATVTMAPMTTDVSTRGAGGAGPAGAPRDGRPGAAWGVGQLTRVLTERELEVLTMVAQGMANGEIAEQLTISPATAKTHVAHLLTKLGARDRIQLVIIAYQSGLVRW